MTNEAATNVKTYDAVVVGAGAAGIGVGVALKHAGIEDFVVVDRHGIGASFDLWPAETRFITPSFPSNSIGMLDLNSIAIGVSPAFSLEVEHPTGREYAAHLKAVAKFFKIPIREQTDVMRIAKVGDDFRIDTAGETLRAKHVIWAAGEFQYPCLNAFTGSELCRHTATIASYEELDGDNFIIVGGYESGVDAAYHLAYRDKRVPGCSTKAARGKTRVPILVSHCRRIRSNGCEKNGLRSMWSCSSKRPSRQSLSRTTSMTLQHRTDVTFKRVFRHCWQAVLKEVTSWSQTCSSNATMVIRC